MPRNEDQNTDETICRAASSLSPSQPDTTDRHRRSVGIGLALFLNISRQMPLQIEAMVAIGVVPWSRRRIRRIARVAEAISPMGKPPADQRKAPSSHSLTSSRSSSPRLASLSNAKVVARQSAKTSGRGGDAFTGRST
jgi:hypothetical protein